MMWFLFKMLFRKNGIKKALMRMTLEQIVEFKGKAMDEENYELVALLEYYLEFKNFKSLNK